MKRAVVVWAWVAVALGLGGCAEGIFVSRPGFVLDSQPRLGEGDFLNPGVALMISAEGGQEVGAQVDPVVRGLVGDGATSGPIDLSGIINQQLAQAGLTEGDLTVTDLFLTLDLVGGAPRVEFVDEPTRVRVSLDELWINGAATARASFDVASFACRLEGSIAEGTPNRRMLTLRDIVVELELGEVDGRFDLQVTDLSFDLAETGIAVVDEEDDPFYYCDFPECQDGSDGSGGCSECHAVCGSVEIVSDAVNLFAANLEELLGGALEDLIRDRLQNFSRLSGEVHLASFLADTLPDLLDSYPVAFELRPSSRGFRTVPTQAGNDLIAWMDLGSKPQALHPCVGEDLGQPNFLLGPAPTTDELGEPRAHLAVGLPTATVDQLLWSFYRSGGLCLQITSADISKLTGGGGFQFNSATVGLLLPGLNRIIGNDAPLLLSLQPQFDINDPGLVQLGTGEGEGEDRDSLLRVLLPPLELGLYAWFEGRWVRLFAIEAAVDVGITPMFATSDKLDLSVDHILIYNLVEKYNELFPGVDLLQIFQAGIELGLGLLAGQGFELPLGLDTLLQSSLGVPLSIELGEPKAAGADRDWLLLGARIGSAAQTYEGPLARVDTRLVAPPTRLVAGEPLRLRAQGVDAAGSPREGLEFQARLDGGAWRGLARGGELVLDSPLLKVPGLHAVEVRARVQGQWQTLDLSPATHAVTVLSLEEGAPLGPSAEEGVESGAGVEGGAGAEGGAGVEGGAGSSSGCACATSPRGAGGVGWGWALALGAAWAWRRRAARASALLALLGAACGDDKPKASNQGTSPPECSVDADCAVHEAGLRCVNGACLGPTGCEGDEDCCADEVCQNGVCDPEATCADDEGCGLGLTCEAGRCQRATCGEDSDCVRGQACLGAVCAAPEGPLCPVTCGEGEVCLAPLARCVARPASCDAVECADGEAMYVENPEALLGPACGGEEASCACLAAAEPAVEGDPTGWLKARVAPDGRVAVAAYDLAKKDLTLRWMEPGADELGEVLHLDGLPDGAGPTLASDRAALGAGPDAGAELDLAVHPDGALGIVYVDRTRKVLRMAASPDGEIWSFLDLDADGQGGRWPDIEPDPDGGWVVAYQGVAPLGAGELQTSLRVAVSGVSDVTRPSDFQTVTLASASAPAPYPALPVGVGATPSLARGSEGTWFVASHDANAGTLELRWWEGSPQDAEALVWVEPQTRSGLPGGSTGVGPRLLAGEGGRLDVVYLDANTGELRHAGATFDGQGLAAPRAELIDVGLSGVPSRQLAMDAALIRLSDGRMVVAWQDTTFADVFVAWTDTEGAVWSTEYSEGDGSEGYFPQLVEEQDGGILLLHGEWIVDAPGHISQSLRLRRL